MGGIVAFSALRFLQLPPLAWGIGAALTFAVLWLPRPPTLAQAVSLVVLVIVLAVESF